MKHRRTPSVDFSLADVELEETLENLDGADNYAAWIFALVEPHLGEKVLEVGAGHGTFTHRIAAIASRVVAVDPSVRCVDLLRTRFMSDPKMEVLQGSIGEATGHGQFDGVVLINVLEHIEDDREALREIFRLLKPGGRLILWVPAFAALYSDFDRRVGHHRRYRKSALRTELTRCEYEIRDLRYVNAVGAIAWFVMARLLRRTPTVGSKVQLFDKYLVPVLRRFERRLRVPFGQSVFAVAVRPVN